MTDIETKLKEIEESHSMGELGYLNTNWLISTLRETLERLNRSRADHDSQDMVDRAKLRAENEKLKADLKFERASTDSMAEKFHEPCDNCQRLREALESISKNGCCDSCQEAALVARAALEGKS